MRYELMNMEELRVEMMNVQSRKCRMKITKDDEGYRKCQKQEEDIRECMNSLTQKAREFFERITTELDEDPDQFSYKDLIEIIYYAHSVL